jgi:hypothetical protein
MPDDMGKYGHMIYTLCYEMVAPINIIIITMS